MNNINITELMNSYRECCRNLWNCYFLRTDSSCEEFDWDIADEFNEICVRLFSSLVLRQIEVFSYEKVLSQRAKIMPCPLKFLHVIPVIETGVPISVNREKNTGYWDHPIDTIKPDEAKLVFVDYFDFDLMGYRDFQYYLVLIESSSVYPQICGYQALIECRYANVFFRPLLPG